MVIKWYGQKGESICRKNTCDRHELCCLLFPCGKSSLGSSRYERVFGQPSEKQYGCSICEKTLTGTDIIQAVEKAGYGASLLTGSQKKATNVSTEQSVSANAAKKEYGL